MEFLECFVREEDHYFGDFPCRSLALWRKEIQLDGGVFFFSGCFGAVLVMVHFAFTAEQPFQVQIGVVQDETLQKIIAGLVPSC